MTYQEIQDLSKMGFSKDEILELIRSEDPAKEVTENELPDTPDKKPDPEPKQLQQEPKKVETPEPKVTPDKTTPAPDFSNINVLNDSINKLTKVLQASNLLTSYMPTPQENSSDMVLASIINPHINDKK